MATILYVFEITFHDFNTGKMFMCFLGILIHRMWIHGTKLGGIRGQDTMKSQKG